MGGKANEGEECSRVSGSFDEERVGREEERRSAVGWRGVGWETTYFHAEDQSISFRKLEYANMSTIYL